ncbi:MAG: hypothetical protein JWQ33_2200, partial [Ramlibacter sp.]|nr:hypothetical protein [Ramlibacter sp.]
MKQTRTITYALLLAAVAGVASAQTVQTPKTRAQVETELATAMQNGEVRGATGITGRDLRPDLYSRPAVVGNSRAQVEAELASAVRNGDMLA